MDSIEQSLLHEYPYPIAKCYERLVGAHEAADRWNIIRYLVEATLKYSASLTVSRYLHNKKSNTKVDAALACLNRPTLGQWSNLLIRCAQYNQSLKESFIQERTFSAVKDDALGQAHRAMLMYSSNRDPGLPKHLTITRFFETFVAYRNRTSGHGSPSSDHIGEITPILEAAVINLLTHLSVLKEIQLMYVSEIRLDRTSYLHSLVSLMGTSPITLADYETDAESALIGHDKQLYLSDVGSEIPLVSMHPLAIYSQSNVFLLHRSDLKRNVEYICHHTGEFYSADRIFEDFKDTFGSVLGGDESVSQQFQPEDIYEESVRMSLIDGVLSATEEQYLLEMRDQLEISSDTANLIEARIREELHIGSATPPVDEKNEANDAATQKLVKSDQGKAKRILFVSYASVRTGFWADLVSRLASTAHINGYVFSIVTPPHTGDYDVSHTASLVSEIDMIVKMHEPDLLLLVPFPSESFSCLFRSRFKNIVLPVVTLDTELVDTGPFSDPTYVAPPAIQVNNHRGGELVGELMLEQTGHQDAIPRFLVMPGLEGAAHSQARVSGFTEYVHGTSPDASIRVLPEGRFNRKHARKVFEDFLFDVDLEKYDGIFCCNDEMALGVLAAVNIKLGADNLARPFSIAGFNNTVEFRGAQHADHRGLLVGSVDQGLDEYVDTVFQVIGNVLAGKSVETQHTIEPKLL